MKQLNNFINEKLKLSASSKLQIKPTNILKHIAYLLGFEYTNEYDKNPHFITGGLKYINIWLSSNTVKDVEVYISNSTWKNIQNEWYDIPQKSKYIIIDDHLLLLKDMIDKEWFTLVWDQYGEIYINDHILYYSIANDSQSYTGNTSKDWMDFFIKKIN